MDRQLAFTWFRPKPRHSSEWRVESVGFALFEPREVFSSSGEPRYIPELREWGLALSLPGIRATNAADARCAPYETRAVHARLLDDFVALDINDFAAVETFVAAYGTLGISETVGMPDDPGADVTLTHTERWERLAGWRYEQESLTDFLALASLLKKPMSEARRSVVARRTAIHGRGRGVSVAILPPSRDDDTGFVPEPLALSAALLPDEEDPLGHATVEARAEAALRLYLAQVLASRLEKTCGFQVLPKHSDLAGLLGRTSSACPLGAALATRCRPVQREGGRARVPEPEVPEGQGVRRERLGRGT